MNNIVYFSTIAFDELIILTKEVKLKSWLDYFAALRNYRVNWNRACYEEVHKLLFYSFFETFHVRMRTAGM